MGEEALHFLIQLCRQRLVMTKHQGGLIDVGNDIGHGEGLAGTRHSEQHLRLVAAPDAVGKLADSLGLVARGLKFRC